MTLKNILEDIRDNAYKSMAVYRAFRCLVRSTVGESPFHSTVTFIPGCGIDVK